MTGTPLVEPSAPELRTHLGCVGTQLTQTAELLVDVGTCAEVHRPCQVFQTVLLEVAGPVALEESHLVAVDAAQTVANLRHVRLVLTVRTILVLHLHHDDGATILDGERSELLAHFSLENLHALHEVGVLLAQTDVLLLQQPPGQTAHFPFGTNVGTGTHDDVHAVLLSQTAELSHVVVASPVELAFTLFVDVPEDVDAHGVHAQCFTHLDAVVPVSLGNARIVNLCSLHNEGLAIEQERTFTCFKRSLGFLCKRGCRHHQCSHEGK